MNSALKTVLTIGLILFSARTLAAEPPPYAPIVNGSSASVTKSSIVKVSRRLDGRVGLCTGSLIARQVVLTAWHCVTRHVNKMGVTVGNKRYAVKRVKIHPDVFIDPEGIIDNDIALIFLKKPVNRPTLSLLVSRQPKPNDKITLMGYGADETGEAGRLRKGISMVSGVERDYFTTLFDSFKTSNSCVGDSGGPALYEYTDSQGVRRSGILGTVSTGTRSDCLIGDETIYISVQSPSVLNFLTKAVKRVKLE